MTPDRSACPPAPTRAGASLTGTRLWVLGLACACAAASARATGPQAAAPQAEDKLLRIYNWSGYIGAETIRDFEAETGIKVQYDRFDSNEMLHSKLLAGRSGYDVVVPSSDWARLQIQGGLLRRLDKQQLPNLRHLDPAIQKLLARADPGNAYTVNWLWGYTTVAINVDKVKLALGALPLPANVWELLFNPEYLAKLKSCGVSMLDSPTEVVPAALRHLGRPTYSSRNEDYLAAAELLRSVRPYITLFSSSGYIADLAEGRICVAMGWSGDLNLARQQAADARRGQRIEVLLPGKGGLLFFDVMAIPADAPRPGNAHRFINYLLRPEVHASLTNQLFYPNPNLASRRFVRPDVAANPTVFVTPQAFSAMVPPETLSEQMRQWTTRVYNSFKSGI